MPEHKECISTVTANTFAGRRERGRWRTFERKIERHFRCSGGARNSDADDNHKLLQDVWEKSISDPQTTSASLLKLLSANIDSSRSQTVRRRVSQIPPHGPIWNYVSLSWQRLYNLNGIIFVSPRMQETVKSRPFHRVVRKIECEGHDTKNKTLLSWTAPYVPSDTSRMICSYV